MLLQCRHPQAFLTVHLLITPPPSSTHTLPTASSSTSAAGKDIHLLHRTASSHHRTDGVDSVQSVCMPTLHCSFVSLSVFNFTHLPVLSALLLILSASRFLVPDFPRLVFLPFLSSAPLHATPPSHPPPRHNCYISRPFTVIFFLLQILSLLFNSVSLG